MTWCNRPVKMALGLGLGVLLLLGSGCSGLDNTPAFNPKTCLQENPQEVHGLQIIRGPRSKQSVIVDMQSPYCNGQVLFKMVNTSGHQVSSGRAVFKVTVEYTGEVIAAEVVESSGMDESFLQKISDIIMDTDFSPWQRDDEDSEFLYPMTFTTWWYKGNGQP